MRPVLDERVRRGMARQLADRRARLAAGALGIGWKVGINDPRMQRHYGIEAPVVGHLTLATAMVPGASHALAGGTRVGVEPEISIHIGDPVAAGASRATIEAAIVGLGPALEVIDLHGPLDDLEHAVAANSFHRAFAIGVTNPRGEGGVVGDAVARFTHNGTLVATVPLAAALADVPALVALVADTLAAFGERLEAGEWLLSGALAAPAWVQPGDVVGLDVDSIGKLELPLTA